MTVRIALNGCGRIGKNFIRAVLADPEALKKISLVVINTGPEEPETLAYSLKYDSLLGTYPGQIIYTKEETKLYIDKLPAISVVSIKESENLDWKPYAIDWVVDASGKYTHASEARKHCAAGAGAVLVTAPAHDEDITIILGVNEQQFDKERHKIVSLGSCTTNALVPMLYTAHKNFGIKQAVMTTVHAYTNTQSLLDVGAHVNDLRRSRAAGLNMVPTTTGALALVDRLLPELAGKVTGASLRVPVPVVSLIDLVCYTEQTVQHEDIVTVFRAAQKQFANIYNTSSDPLVSSDFHGNPASVSIDLDMSYASGACIKLFGWYDNEWGYSSRLKDFFIVCV